MGMFSRRQMMQGSATFLALSGFARMAWAEPMPLRRDAAEAEVMGYGALLPDPAGILDLPSGFSYRILSEAGRQMQDGLQTPFKMDGMGCFPRADGKLVLIRNHELYAPDFKRSAFARGELDRISQAQIYDFVDGEMPAAGGTTTLIYDPLRQRMESDFLSLAGTSINCGGGATLHNSWLSCEETVARKGEGGQGNDHGFVFEVFADQDGLTQPVPLREMGRFRHEAAASDPRTGIVYLTEDQEDGLFYRYLPHDLRRLSTGGRLQALVLRDRPDMRQWNEVARADQSWLRCDWIDLEGADNPYNDLRARGHAVGATLFARGEGVHMGHGELYFTCTSGGPKRLGQVMRYRPSAHEGQDLEKDHPALLQIFAQPMERSLMEMGDNLTVAPWGHLIICEDKSSGANFLRGITPEGKIYPIARNPRMDPLNAAGTSEFAGACFAPDGDTLFVNIYYPGMTLAITGPWAGFNATRMAG